LAWSPPRQFAAKNKVKLLLNLCLIAQAAIPRGGVISVDLSGQDETLAMRVEAKGPNPRLANGIADLVAGRPESGVVDAHSIQPFFTGLVARECGMEVAITVEAESVTFEARPTGVKG
jgi:histidine phosphotransferase ChpT